MPQTPRHLRFRPACVHEQDGAQRHCTKPLREERYVCKTRGDSGARRQAARDAGLGRPEGPRAPGGRHAAAGAPATAERPGLTTALLFLLLFLCLIFWIFVPWFSGYASVRSRLFREGRRA